MAYGITGGIVEFAYPGDVLTFTVDSSASTSVVGGNAVALLASSSFKVEQAGAKSVRCVGVALHDAAAGAKLSVARVGVYFLKAAGTVASGALVETAATGQVDVHTAASTTYPYVIGIALEDIASGQSGRVELRLG